MQAHEQLGRKSPVDLNPLKEQKKKPMKKHMRKLWSGKSFRLPREPSKKKKDLAKIFNIRYLLKYFKNIKLLPKDVF